MRILLLSDGIMPFVTGGMQQHSYFLSKHLTLKKCNVTLVHCLYDENIPSHHEINKHLFSNEEKLFKIITLSFPKSLRFPGHYIYNSWRYSKLVYEAVKNELDNFEFIYIKGFSGWKLLRMQSKQLNNPTIGINFHGMNMFLPTNGLKLVLSNLLLRPFVRFNMKQSDYVFSYGGKVTSTIINSGLSKEKIIEIPTGIENKFIINENSISLNKRLNFLFVGRDDPLKGLDNIFIAIKTIDSSLCNFEFIGPITQKVIKSNVTYHGLLKNKNDIYNVLDKCDVLILPSYSEGMPNVILEAMSRGLIIIASDVGAVNLLVSNENGVLISNPSSENIINAIHNITSSGSKDLMKMKYNSLMKISNSFSWDIVSKQLINKIENLTN